MTTWHRKEWHLEKELEFYVESSSLYVMKEWVITFKLHSGAICFNQDEQRQRPSLKYLAFRSLYWHYQTSNRNIRRIPAEDDFTTSKWPKCFVGGRILSSTRIIRWRYGNFYEKPTNDLKSKMIMRDWLEWCNFLLAPQTLHSMCNWQIIFYNLLRTHFPRPQNSYKIDPEKSIIQTSKTSRTLQDSIVSSCIKFAIHRDWRMLKISTHLQFLWCNIWKRDGAVITNSATETFPQKSIMKCLQELKIKAI